MRILTIRLENIASLQGHHCVELTEGALAGHNLFAITGPTGAGKSTLLDALCLALYGNTPRLRQAPSKASTTPDVGSDQLTTADPRTLLRRGESSGFAEVDFEGCDGEHYRARWSVRRARQRADGRLQSADQQLSRIADGRVLADNKREFEQQISERLGLSFTQFTRAVLLAQSEFSAFLKADDNTRSELLERLTDTALYSRLSIAAHQRTATARGEVERLEARLDSAPPADAEQRRALEAAVERSSALLDEHQQQLESRQQRRQWLVEDKRLEQRWQEAQRHYDDADQRWQAMTETRQRVAQWQLLSQVRHDFESIARQSRQLDELEHQHGDSRERLSRALEHQQQTESALQQQEQALQAAREARQSAQPALDRLFEQEQRLDHLQDTIRHEQQQHTTLEERIGTLDHELEELSQQRTTQQQQLDALRQRLPGTLDDGEHRRQLQGAAHEARERVLSLEQLERQWQQWADCHARHQRTREAIGEAETRLERLQAQTREARQQREQQAERYRMLETSITRLRDARSAVVERLRDQLTPETPCPVCGSYQHPWRDQPPAHSAEAQLERTRAEEDRQLEEAARALTEAETGERDCSEAAHALASRLTGMQETLDAVERENEACRAPLASRQDGARLLEQDTEQAQHQLIRWLEKARAQEQAHQQTLEAFERDRRERLPLEQSVTRLGVEIERRESALAQLREQRDELSRQLAPRQQEADQLRASLVEALAQDASAAARRQRLDEALTRQQQAVETARDQRDRHRRTVTELEQQLDRLNTRIEALQQSLALHRQHVADWREHHPDIDEPLLEELLQLPAATVAHWQEQLSTIEQQRNDSDVLRRERFGILAHHRRDPIGRELVDDPDHPDPTAWRGMLDGERQRLDELIDALQTRLTALQQQRDGDLQALGEDDRRRREAAALAAELHEARARYQRHGRISALIGSADGRAFRRIAQGWNLERLLEHANRHLASLARRYRLRRGGSLLGLLVIDTDMGDEQRSVHSLSGGETFLVSLALALGLASMASDRLAIGTLFIDEGFGSLDAASLAQAMDTLDGLQAQGRQVGVISHVHEMHERIPVQVRVTPRGNGTSTVTCGRF
ncbi:exonuclease SbcC [Kushneria sinocarnis]|uniref:Nuclease SbcCD subunit C n=1 Tax=Kushneria sinocarnis TaxID=595502 RepID=A0A420WV73_9GAMM|nr:AAA family ATPase [Kushneria sinocarnis]RKR02449.1 exonuclease SbcC [Kushneria sinocarnis]